MPWYQIDVTSADGERFDDQIQAFNEQEARILVENLNYRLNSIRTLRFRSAYESVKKLVLWSLGRGAEYQHRKYMEHKYGPDWNKSDVE